MVRSNVRLHIPSSPAICMTAHIPLTPNSRAKRSETLSQRGDSTGRRLWNDRWRHAGKPSIPRHWSIHVIRAMTPPHRLPCGRRCPWSMALQHATVSNGLHLSNQGCCCSGRCSYCRDAALTWTEEEFTLHPCWPALHVVALFHYSFERFGGGIIKWSARSACVWVTAGIDLELAANPEAWDVSTPEPDRVKLWNKQRLSAGGQ